MLRFSAALLLVGGPIVGLLFGSLEMAARAFGFGAVHLGLGQLWASEDRARAGRRFDGGRHRDTGAVLDGFLMTRGGRAKSARDGVARGPRGAPPFADSPVF
jgi:hypothetical protein